MAQLRASRAALLGLFAATAVAVGVTAIPATAAEGIVLGADRADAVTDSYIVVVKDSAAPRSASARTASTLTAKYGGTVTTAWQNSVNGFAARMSPAQARKLAADPAVAYVEQDAQVKMTEDQLNPPSWGLDRVDQRNLPLDNKYSFGTRASNVTAYVIDTGVRVSHTTFEGRATWGTNTVDTNNTDCNGHGTHVAGTVGGKEYGIAKGVKIVGVKVLNCQGSGTTSGVISGIDWVSANAVKPAVANMSLGGGASTTLDTAVRNSIAKGITYSLASANDNKDGCNYSPARVAEGITVNASDNKDARATFSNWGTCTDIFAPGVGIMSAWMTDDTSTKSISGTSMAAPHVAGAAAVWLANKPGDTPAQVQAGLIAAATPSKVTNPGTGSPNRLLYIDPGTQTTPVELPSPGDQTGTVGVGTSVKLSATGGTGPYTWTASGLPAGITLGSSTANAVVAEGTPTTAGAASVSVTVKDSAGTSATATFKWTIEGAGGDLTLPNPGDQTGTVGTDTGLKLVVSGGTAPYTWSATGLPAGIALEPGTTDVALIGGVPTAGGSHSVTVTVQDSAGATGSTTFTWTIEGGGGGDLTLPNPGDQTGDVGIETGVKLVVSGGTAPYTWSATGLPAGVSAQPSDSDVVVISGTPTAAGANEVTVTVKDSKGATGSVKFTWTIEGGGGGDPTITNPGDQTGKVGVDVALQLEVSGGSAPYTWSAGALPTGLSISNDGLISGKPSAAGTFQTSVTVTDSAGKAAKIGFAWTITGGTCTPGQKLTNPGFESGATGWSSSVNVIGQHASAGKPSHGGTYSAWLGGWGRVSNEYVSQTVAVPTGCANYKLSFWLRIDTAEYENVAYDKLTVTAGGTTLGTFSNIDKGGYRQVTYDLAQFAGKSVSLRFASNEDSNLQTSFVVDDVTLDVS
ncbi:Alkaline serine exoprotease A precursor [Alloactinosynnema sp. L-07]|uniref:S8 family peptidase n=1 Tax=Alloactinosynnema sp. L-07 TaxID=1653480 RepID=UPI00065EF519|nr:S8 family peptidase [Alloactinosynnema sp. L-07]CRK61917.1 Alkaline serine exoprotease A precursor [Alloactinosynnema sp. L-07]